ncbi:MAG: hypothetical protein AABW80_00430 [Nanoarchaeota archaeon]
MDLNPILKFQGACITKITYLLKKIAELKGEKDYPNRGIIIFFSKDFYEGFLRKDRKATNETKTLNEEKSQRD